MRWQTRQEHLLAATALALFLLLREFGVDKDIARLIAQRVLE